jgi:hypothetical protein
MSEFDFEELVADMLGITDEQRENDGFLEDAFYLEFEIELEQGYELAKALIMHTPKVQAGLSGKTYHAFVSKSQPVMLMKVEAP